MLRRLHLGKDSNTVQFIMFTKHLEGLDVPGIITALQSVGVQGADLCVRDGYPVNPDNIDTALSAAVQQFADAGLTIPLVTAPGDFNRPEHRLCRTLLCRLRRGRR